MKRIEYLKLLSNLFEYKIIKDKFNNEYVVLKENIFTHIDNISDKTAFEAIENHIHLIDNITKEEFKILPDIAESIGKAVLCNLKVSYPQKHFVIFVSISLSGSMIIRFHQKWENEDYYYNVADFDSSNEKVFMFED